MRNNPFRRAGPILAFLLAGCAIGPDYKRPDTAEPSAYRGETAGSKQSLADLAWWDVYRDPRLVELIRLSLSDGFDVRVAAARVAESRAIAAQVHGQLFPSIGYNAEADRGRNSVLGNPFPSQAGRLSARLPNPPDTLSLPATSSITRVGYGSPFLGRYVSGG